MITLTLTIVVLWLAIAYWAGARRIREARQLTRLPHDEMHHLRK